MKRLSWLLLMAVLLFQTAEFVAPNPPVMAMSPSVSNPLAVALSMPGQNVICKTIGTTKICASVSNARPARYTNVTVYGKLTINGVAQAGQTMRTVWHYKTATSYCNGITNATGLARCTRNISSAKRGYQVRITVTIGGYTVTTSFTPK